MSAELEARLKRAEKRLRQVLELISNAKSKYTTIPSDQGDFEGHDRFLSPDITDEADELLGEWDEEDEDEEAPTPEPAP